MLITYTHTHTHTHTHIHTAHTAHTTPTTHTAHTAISPDSNSTGSTSSSGPTDEAGSGGLNYAILAMCIVLVLVILLMVVIIITFMLRGRSKSKLLQLKTTSRQDSLEYSEVAVYRKVAEPAPPHLPKRFPELNSEIDAYATVNLEGPGERDGGIELRDPSFSLVETPTKIDLSTVHHLDQLQFMEKNPLYADIGGSSEKARSKEVAGSIPSLDMLTDSPHSSQLNIYANPAEMAPPIPRRPPTPELMGEPIYSEANIHPNIFQHQPQPQLNYHPNHTPSPSPPPENELDIFPNTSIYSDPKPLLRAEGPKEVSPKNIRELRNLGMGQFGQVILAEIVGLSRRDLRLGETSTCGNDNGIKVAVKRLKASAEPQVKEAFEKEIKFMSRLDDENVVRLLAICPKENPFIVMEYMENGDLNQFLRKHEYLPDSTPDSGSTGDGGLTSRQLTHICVQVANGMRYLSSLKFVHRDLATRNCLVGKNLKIKIADFGMSCSLYSSYYYRISGRPLLPIRWMANECFYGKFSEKTDVWAFGVTMWEIFTFAKNYPYQDMSDQEVIDDAIKGPDRMLLGRPDSCPLEVYKLMKRCWRNDPDKRVGFKDVHSMLVLFYED